MYSHPRGLELLIAHPDENNNMSATHAGTPASSEKPFPMALFAALAVALAIALMPPPDGLSIAGQRILAILAFAVIVWLTEALDYAVSSVVIVALIALALGSAPIGTTPELLGTSRALAKALSGFSNSALALVAAALFLSVAMTATGLDRRIAYRTLNRFGTTAKGILVGAIAVTIILSLMVPSATARVACIVPIMTGIIAAFGVEKRSLFAASLMIVVAQATSIWNMGIMTSAAQNMLTVGFLEKSIKLTPSWSDWFIAGAPYAAVMSVVLFVVVRRLMPPEKESIEGGKEAVRKAMAEMGPMTAPEWRVLVTIALLIGFWVTEKQLHNIDTTTVTIVGLAILFLPRIGVMTWPQVQKQVPWGTIIVFGVGISLGTALLDTKAALWMADYVVQALHLDTIGNFGIFAGLSLFLILIHIGFASATSLTSALLPIMIAVLERLNLDINVMGMTMLLGFVVSFGFILPINAPQNMVCLGTETFTSKQFTRIGLWLTGIGYLLLLVFALTWWKFLGYV